MRAVESPSESPSREEPRFRLGAGEVVGFVVLVALVIAGFSVVRDTVQPGRASSRRLLEGTVRERRQAARELGTVKRGGIHVALSALPAAIEGDRDALVRTEAARSIGMLITTVAREGQGIETNAAVRGLTAGLKDPDPTVREVCALTLAGFGRFLPRAPNELVDLLESDSELTVRTAAVTALVQFPELSPEAIQGLFKGMDDPELPLRTHCSDALSRATPPKESLDELVALLKHPRNEIRYRAADLIGRLGKDGARALPDLIVNLSAPTPRPRREGDPSSAGWDPAWAASRALTQIALVTGQERMAIDALIANLQSQDIDRVVTCASALEAFGARACAALPRLIELLDQLLSPPSFGDRAALLASAIGTIGPCDPRSADAAVAVLIKALGTRNEFTQSRAAVGLGRYGKQAKSALPALGELRSSMSLVVRFEASRAFATITEQSR